MPTVNVDRLKSTLANSKLQATNNAAYQTMLGLIDSAVNSSNELSTAKSELQAIIESQTQITVVEWDTSSIGTSFELTVFVKGLTIFKDIGGNASANNITLIGTVEGVVDPVINTDYGIYRVYATEGLFFQW